MSRSNRPQSGLLPACLLVPAAAALAGGPSTGNLPLNDLGPGFYTVGTFQVQGGLYPGGLNTPPPAHLNAALLRAGQVAPRDALGNPDPAAGRICLISIGMSNTTHEYAVFERQEDTSAARHARLTILNTALGGQAASDIAPANAAYWQVVQQRIAAMGLTNAQVQAAWLKEADRNPPNDFPGHALNLRAELESIVQNLHDLFPNLVLCYVSSRTYGGYNTGNPEPQSYESGFAFKWLIEDQINGDPGLNYDAGAGTVEAPLLLWGPYLWADGVNPRSDGLTWLREDFETDGVHPSPTGEEKVGDLLSGFFASDATAQPWFAAQPGAGLVAVDAEADAYVSAASPATNFGTHPTLVANGGATPSTIYLRFNLSAVAGAVLSAKLSLRVTTDGLGGGDVSLVSNTTWGEATITAANAPPIDGGLLRTLPQATRDGTIAADVTAAVNADGDRVLTFALTTPTAGGTRYHSREAGQPPRLILVRSGVPGLPGDMNCDAVVNARDVGPFALALTSPAGYASAYPSCDIGNGDLNGDSLTGEGDVPLMVALLLAP
jgi:hypothetical protein